MFASLPNPANGFYPLKHMRKRKCFRFFFRGSAMFVQVLDKLPCPNRAVYLLYIRCLALINESKNFIYSLQVAPFCSVKRAGMDFVVAGKKCLSSSLVQYYCLNYFTIASVTSLFYSATLILCLNLFTVFCCGNHFLVLTRLSCSYATIYLLILCGYFTI